MDRVGPHVSQMMFSPGSEERMTNICATARSSGLRRSSAYLGPAKLKLRT